MKKMIITSLAVAATLTFMSVPDSDAQTRGGQGQRLRDGSCGTTQPGTQERTGKNWSYRNRTGVEQGTGAGNRLGDGTQPRPMDGTGFGFGARNR